VAQNAGWDTVVYVCNPNDSAATVDLTFVRSGGTEAANHEYTLPANGSGKYLLSGILGGSTCASGSLEIEASQGVAAFALYHNLKTGSRSYAGVSAVEP